MLAAEVFLPARYDTQATSNRLYGSYQVSSEGTQSDSVLTTAHSAVASQISRRN